MDRKVSIEVRGKNELGGRTTKEGDRAKAKCRESRGWHRQRKGP